MTEFTQTVIDCSIPTESGHYYTIQCIDSIVDYYHTNHSNQLLIEYHPDGFSVPRLNAEIDFGSVGFASTDLYRDGDKLIVSFVRIGNTMLPHGPDVTPRLEIIGSGKVTDIGGRATVTDYEFDKLIAVPMPEGGTDEVVADECDSDVNCEVTSKAITTKDLVSLLFPHINEGDYVGATMTADDTTLNIYVFTKLDSLITISDLAKTDKMENDPIAGDSANQMAEYEDVPSLYEMFAALGIGADVLDEDDWYCDDAETEVSHSVGVIADAFMEDRDYFRGWCDNLSMLMQDRADVARDTANEIAASFINMAFSLPALDDDTSADTGPCIPEEISQAFRRMFLGLPYRD